MYDPKNIDQRDLWMTRFYYLAMLGGGGFIFPFINLFYVRQGLSGQQVGWVVAFSSLVALFSAPVWTEWNTRLGRQRLVLTIGLLLSALAMVWLGFQQAFVPILLVAGLRILVNAGVAPLSDSMAVRVIGATRAGFGSVRVFGSIGWALLVLSSGFLVQRFGLWVAFAGYAASMILAVLILRGISQPTPAPPGGPPAASRTGFRKVAHQILSTPMLGGLALMLVITGLANNGVLQFENVFLDQLGAREGLIGIAGMVSSVVEVPAMLWADRMVRRHGSQKMLLVGLLLTGLLRALVLLFPSVTSIILQRGLGGIGFSLITVGQVKFISENTRSEDTPSAMAIYSVSIASLVGILGTPISGFAFDQIGARWLYAVAAGGYGLGWLVLRLAQATKK